MTTATPERTIAAVEAEIAATRELRDQSKGAIKGMLTRKLKALEAELVTIAEINELNADQPPSQRLPGGSANGHQEPHIVDSDVIDGVRYSIDGTGIVWAPAAHGERRCGEPIGRLVRDKGWTVYRAGQTEKVATNRSRRAVLAELVAALPSV